ncbi:hypothetical protein OEZ86_008265 [Tetradesmus obliquus]|nr:hypothetical protein OEZ86_008265 [Tetradesmus obliquus]
MPGKSRLLRKSNRQIKVLGLAFEGHACASWQQAALLFADHSHEFNAVHTAALISHLPKVLARQPPLSQAAAADVAQLLADLAQLAEEVLPCCGPRELSNMAQGLAAGGCYSRRLMQLLLGRCVLSSLRPQELASLAWAVAKTGHQVHEGWTAELLACSSRYMGHASSSSSSSSSSAQLHTLDDSVAAAPALANVIHALPHLPGGVILNQLLAEKLAEGQQLQQLAGAARLRFNECGARELVALAQGFAGLGFCPGVGWLAAHSQRCEALGGEGFSASERQLLEHAWAVLARLLQQQQSAEATTERVLPLEQEQWNGLQGAPLLARPASTGGNVEQQRLRAAALAASV